MNDLQQRSIEIILAGQFDGAYAACLSFSQYGYCWLRDGTWIAHGMDAAGQTQSARAFHRWVGRTLTRYSDKVTHILNLLAAGKQPAESDYLPTRFGLDGSIGLEDWGDFQMDGYGTWLWGLAQFVNKHGDDDLWQEARPATELVINYLAALWDSPNYDCWEEHREHIHPATLAAIYGGMKAVQVFLPELVTPTLLEAMCSFTLTNGVASDGHFMKYLGNEAVDASLLWIGTPYRLVDIHDVHFLATLAKIEQD
ncbi:MAG: glycoside hydrolase family 15 protein [Anaerolineae bacterium]